ncbi:MAG: IPT/TIG domain-containing protein [Verrucomicrobiota bacterium]
MTPPLGPEIGGILIKLTGINFGSSGVVTMGTNFSQIPTSGWTDSEIQFTLPPGQGTNVPIIVNSGGQSSAPASFVYFRPAITNVSPATGPTAGGSTITLNGQYFGTNGTVTFGGNFVPVAATNWSDTQLRFTLPAGQGTNVSIVVTSGGQVSAPASFSYFVPGITGMSPLTGPTTGGAMITLTGTNFGTSGVVMFDQTMVFVVATNWTDTQIRFTLPAGQGANIPIAVLTGGQISAPTNFSYFGPGIASVNPPTGPTAGGTTITLTGTNFGTSGALTFNGNIVLVAATNWSDSQIRFLLPQGQGTNQPIVVLTAGQSSPAASFNYAAPVITLINPTSAPTAGSAVLTITGSNFGASGTVKVGNKPATTVFPGSGWSHTQISCLIPSGSGESLPVVVTVAGQASNPFYFSYLRPTLTIMRAGSGVVLAWPTNAPDYWPEESTSLSGLPWSFIPQGRSINGAEYNSVVPVAPTNTFFRLRQL